jgi:hypothetical protein
MDHNLKQVNLFMTSISLGIKRTGPDLLRVGANTMTMAFFPGILKVYLRIYYARLQMVFDNKPMDVSLTQKKMQLWRHLGSLHRKSNCKWFR